MIMTHTRIGHHDFGYNPDPWKEWGYSRPLPPVRGRPIVLDPVKEAKLAAAMAAIKATMKPGWGVTTGL